VIVEKTEFEPDVELTEFMFPPTPPEPTVIV
jgi:hypothetical protein